MRLLIDCDGVLSDFVSAYASVVHELTGVPLNLGRVDTYYIKDSKALQDVAAATGSPVGYLHAGVEEYIRRNTERFVSDMPPIPGAQRTLAALRTKGTEAYIVTAPYRDIPGWYDARVQWLYRTFGITQGKIIATEAKDLVCGDVFIDDKPSHVDRWSQQNPQKKGILFKATYNAGYMTWADIVL